jgi:glycosyltransferase involved in cell wall biosynthesis
MSKIVTVVTATWGRPKTILARCIPSVEKQTYHPIQHIIVTDGYDEDLNKALREAGYSEGDFWKRLVTLGRNWTGFSGDGAIGAVPRNIGAYLAAGDYICYLDDDDEWAPNHVESQAAELDKDYDLVVSRWRSVGGTWEQRHARPKVGHTGTSMFMHRAELLKISGWQMDGYSGDGLLTERWVAAGAKWSLCDEATVLYHGHHMGAPEVA